MIPRIDSFRRFRSLFGWALLVLFLAACSDDGGDDEATDTDATDVLTDNGDDGDVVDDDVADVSADSGDVSDQADDTEPQECTASRITIIRGTVEDESATPIEGAKAQSCVRVQDGTLYCLRPADTDANGLFASSVPMEAQCMVNLTMRVLDTQRPYPTVYCPIAIPEPGGSPVVAVEEPFVLREAPAPAALPPLGDENAERTVTLADVAVDITPSQLQYSGGEYADLAARSVDPAGAGLCFLGDTQPDLLIGFYPEANVDGTGFDFIIDNNGGLPADAAVDLYVLGGLDCRLDDGTLLEEGDWHLFGQGVVSADGTTIQPDVPLPCLTWLGVEAR